MKLLYKIIFKLERLIDSRRVENLKVSFKYCGADVIINPTCDIVLPSRLEIGENSSISSYTVIYATYGVTIGKNCWISSNCGISSYNHIQNSFNRKDTSNDFKFSKPVKIGDNVWIGMNSCILPGVEIGNNSIIGSGSVVTKNIPENEIWVGNPAKFIRKLEF